MKRIASVAVGAMVAFGFVSCRFSTARAVAESPGPFVRMADVEQKRQLVLDEIERLGPDRPWAGVYHGNVGVPFSLVIAPESGCVTTIFGCFGLRDSAWSPVREISHEDGNRACAVIAFEERYAIEGSTPILRGESGAEYWRTRFESLGYERVR